jgi:hypothetical protein
LKGAANKWCGRVWTWFTNLWLVRLPTLNKGRGISLPVNWLWTTLLHLQLIADRKSSTSFNCCSHWNQICFWQGRYVLTKWKLFVLLNRIILYRWT